MKAHSTILFDVTISFPIREKGVKEHLEINMSCFRVFFCKKPKAFPDHYFAQTFAPRKRLSCSELNADETRLAE